MGKRHKPVLSYERPSSITAFRHFPGFPKVYSQFPANLSSQFVLSRYTFLIGEDQRLHGSTTSEKNLLKIRKLTITTSRQVSIV